MWKVSARYGERADTGYAVCLRRDGVASRVRVWLKAASSVPSRFNRAMWLRGMPKTLVKLPPIRILPSG